MLGRLSPLLVVLVAAGCFGSDGSSVSATKGESLVLAQSDVGKDFTQFDKGKQRLADLTPPRDKPDRFGRKGGWKARFSRPGSHKTQGPLVISSLADLFGSAKGARDDFALYRDALGQFVSTGGRPIAAPDLGDESYAITYRQGVAPNAVRYYVIAWRDGSVTASLNMNGFEDRFSREQALELARMQDERIRAAAS